MDPEYYLEVSNSPKKLNISIVIHLFLLGHLGHIILPLPVVNPMFYINIQRLLKVTCIHCHRWEITFPSSLGIVLRFGTGTVLFLLNLLRFFSWILKFRSIKPYLDCKIS
jgi:hypothetical protein